MIPKFRAWDKKVKEMIEDVTSIHFKTEMIATSNLYFYPFKDIELTQSTGLVDENKAEVFQDDIVWHDQNEDYGVVEIDEAKFVIRWQDGYVEDLFERIDLLEVVGNIHEHSHLLDVEDDKNESI